MDQFELVSMVIHLLTLKRDALKTMATLLDCGASLISRPDPNTIMQFDRRCTRARCQIDLINDQLAVIDEVATRNTQVVGPVMAEFSSPIALLKSEIVDYLNRCIRTLDGLTTEARVRHASIGAELTQIRTKRRVESAYLSPLFPSDGSTVILAS